MSTSFNKLSQPGPDAIRKVAPVSDSAVAAAMAMSCPQDEALAAAALAKASSPAPIANEGQFGEQDEVLAKAALGRLHKNV